MAACPTCGALSGDENVFCPSCGRRLAKSLAPGAINAATTRKSSVPSMPAVAVTPEPCTGCGAFETDDGKGNCRKCGQRLGAPLTLSLLPTKPPEAPTPVPGTSIGPWKVQQAASRSDAIATKNGERALVAIGDTLSLACEAEALEQLSLGRADPPLRIALPKVLSEALDADPPHLVLSPPSEQVRKLWDAAAELSGERAFDFTEAVLDAVQQLERAGFSFAPAPTDFLLEGGALAILRLRDARRLGPKERVDAKAVIDALGECFLPEPAVRTVPRFVRAIAPTRESFEGKKPALEDIRREVKTAREETAAPIGEGPIATLIDPGLWRPYQQDATAVAHGVATDGEPWTVLVVCDGVSSSPTSGVASRGAAKTACEALDRFARAGELKGDAATRGMIEAIRHAHQAVCTAHREEPAPTPPGTTIVAAFIHRRRATIGWVGDSRAYWCEEDRSILLTRDHSWVNEALARGEIESEDEVEGALAHTITRCLGPLESFDGPSDVAADVVVKNLSAPGSLVLCSDGLWNYASKIADLELVMRAAEGLAAPGLARFLVSYALARGGQDNVSVAIYQQE